MFSQHFKTNFKPKENSVTVLHLSKHYFSLYFKIVRFERSSVVQNFYSVRRQRHMSCYCLVWLFTTFPTCFLFILLFIISACTIINFRTDEIIRALLPLNYWFWVTTTKRIEGNVRIYFFPRLFISIVIARCLSSWEKGTHKKLFCVGIKNII